MDTSTSTKHEAQARDRTAARHVASRPPRKGSSPIIISSISSSIMCMFIITIISSIVRSIIIYHYPPPLPVPHALGSAAPPSLPEAADSAVRILHMLFTCGVEKGCSEEVTRRLPS